MKKNNVLFISLFFVLYALCTKDRMAKKLTGQHHHVNLLTSQHSWYYYFGHLNQFLHLLQPENIEVESVGEEEEVEQDLLEWGEAGKIFRLLEGADEMDEHKKVVDRIRVFQEGITKHMEGLKLQDEGLANVQDAVAKHLLRTLGPLLDAAMVSSMGSKPHLTASISKNVKCKCPYSYLYPIHFYQYCIHS